MVAVVVVVMITSLPPILIGFHYLQNNGYPYQILLNPLSPHIIANIKQTLPNRTMPVMYPKLYGNNCSHMQKRAIANAQDCNKQANSTTAHTTDHTEHSVTHTLATYAANSVHHIPITMNALPLGI